MEAFGRRFNKTRLSFVEIFAKAFRRLYEDTLPTLLVQLVSSNIEQQVLATFYTAKMTTFYYILHAYFMKCSKGKPK